MSSTYFGHRKLRRNCKRLFTVVVVHTWNSKRKILVDFFQRKIKHDRFWVIFRQHTSKTWPSIFSSCNPFPSWPSKPNDMHLLLMYTSGVITIKTESFFQGFLWIMFFKRFKEMPKNGNVCVCVLPTGMSFLIVPDLRHASWPLRKSCHPSLYPAFPLEVFEVASFLSLSPQ